jgi:SAM-dependent methyltransferase
VEELTTAQSWDEIWSRDSSPAPQSRTRLARSWQRVLAQLLSHASPGAGVLELGCAPGTMLADMHRIRPDVGYRGVDYAPSGLLRCQRLLRDAGIDAELELGDITAELPLAPADLVVSFGLIEHFDDPTEAIGYHRNLCRPGGTVGVTVPNYSHPLVVGLLRRYSPETLATHNLAAMSTDRLAQAMEGAGLVNVECAASGGPILPNGRASATVGGRVYRHAARAWNLASGVLPSAWPWPAVIWATGHHRP